MELINEVLDLSKVESGNYELKKTSVNLNALIKEILAIISPLARKQGLQDFIQTICNATEIT